MKSLKLLASLVIYYRDPSKLNEDNFVKHLPLELYQELVEVYLEKNGIHQAKPFKLSFPDKIQGIKISPSGRYLWLKCLESFSGIPVWNLLDLSSYTLSLQTIISDDPTENQSKEFEKAIIHKCICNSNRMRSPQISPYNNLVLTNIGTSYKLASIIPIYKNLKMVLTGVDYNLQFNDQFIVLHHGGDEKDYLYQWTPNDLVLLSSYPFFMTDVLIILANDLTPELAQQLTNPSIVKLFKLLLNGVRTTKSRLVLSPNHYWLLMHRQMNDGTYSPILLNLYILLDPKLNKPIKQLMSLFNSYNLDNVIPKIKNDSMELTTQISPIIVLSVKTKNLIINPEYSIPLDGSFKNISINDFNRAIWTKFNRLLVINENKDVGWHRLVEYSPTGEFKEYAIIPDIKTKISGCFMGEDGQYLAIVYYQMIHHGSSSATKVTIVEIYQTIFCQPVVPKNRDDPGFIKLKHLYTIYIGDGGFQFYKNHPLIYIHRPVLGAVNSLKIEDHRKRKTITKILKVHSGLNVIDFQSLTVSHLMPNLWYKQPLSTRMLNDPNSFLEYYRVSPNLIVPRIMNYTDIVDLRRDALVNLLKIPNIPLTLPNQDIQQIIADYHRQCQKRNQPKGK